MADSQRPLGDQPSNTAINAGQTVKQTTVSGLSATTVHGNDKFGGAASGAVANANAQVMSVSETMSVSESGGWRSFIPPNANGKVPWRWRWLGLLPLVAAFMITGWWVWGTVEDEMNQQALAHLSCADIDTSDLDLDWSYRSVTVDGQLPAGVTADDVVDVIDNGADDIECVVNKDIGFSRGDSPHVDKVTVPAALFPGDTAAIPAPDADLSDTDVVDTDTLDTESAERPEPVASPTETPDIEPEPIVEAPTLAQVAALTASAAFDGQTITLTGDVATEAQRSALVAAAASSVGEANVVDELTTADGDPSDTSDVRIEELSAALATFDGTTVLEGRASVTDEALAYDLVALTAGAAEAIDLAGTGSIQVAETDLAETDLAEADMADAPAPSFTG